MDKLLFRYRKIKTRRLTDEEKNIESIIVTSFSPRVLYQNHPEIALHLSVHTRSHPSSFLSTELQTLIFEYLDACISWMFLNRYDADQWVLPTFTQRLKSHPISTRKTWEREYYVEHADTSEVDLLKHHDKKQTYQFMRMAYYGQLEELKKVLPVPKWSSLIAWYALSSLFHESRKISFKGIVDRLTANQLGTSRQWPSWIYSHEFLYDSTWLQILVHRVPRITKQRLWDKIQKAWITNEHEDKATLLIQVENVLR